MNLNFRATAKIISLVTIFAGITNMVPAAVSVIYKEYNTALIFMICGLAYIAVGTVLFFSIRISRKRIKTRDGILIVSITWLIMILLGAISLYLAADIQFINALFESASGYTTTGATVISDVEVLPKGIQFFRAQSHWIGGLGIIVLVIAIIPLLGGGAQVIARAEGSKSLKDKILAKYSDTAKRLLLYYTVLTVSCALLLIPGDMNIFDSISHAMSAVSTGGFTNYNVDISQIGSYYNYWVIIFFMLFGSVNFTLFYHLFSVHWKDFFKDTEFKWYLSMIIAFSLLITACLLTSGTVTGFGNALTHGTFNLVSMMSTTGFASIDFNIWPSFACLLLLSAMIIGGCSASTSGGIKVFRIVIAVKLIKRNILRRLHPAAQLSIKDDEGPLPSDLVSAVVAYIFFYVVVIFIGSLLLAAENKDFVTTVSALISCLGNIGPGLGDVGPMSTYNSFSVWGKLVLSFVMIAGRLELFGLMLLFTRRFWNPNRVRV